MKKKYKVEFLQTDTFVVDVLATNEQEAIKLASKKWDKITEKGTEHYHQIEDTRSEVGTVYDVTGTDDPFNP